MDASPIASAHADQREVAEDAMIELIPGYQLDQVSG